jgi:hypothetical protein
MDTMTYASVAILPWSVAEKNKQDAIPETEFTSFNLTYLSLSNCD